MNLADLSIRRPIFITCIIFVMLAVGWVSFKKLGVDLFPDVTFPVVTVNVPYPGAGPEEIETLVTKPVEDELSTLSGMKRLTSVNQEGISTVIAEFALETDIKFAEQQIRDRLGAAKSKLPRDIKEPIIRRIDPADQPIITFSLTADLPPAKLFDVADDLVRPRLEQVSKVGLVEVLGGRKREVQVQLDRAKLKQAGIAASTVASRLAASGENVPLGKVEEGNKETVLRTLGQFKSLDDISRVIVNFFGNDVPVRVGDVGTVVDTLSDEKSRTFLNGNKALFLNAFRQSGANTLDVVAGLKKQLGKINGELADLPGKPKLEIIRDGSVWINANVDDVKESIMIGIVLAIVVVYFFLANGRSTFITGLALPNSLIGAFILMAIAGFSVNIMTLLALSLSVGLLIDDAIVVRENIFRHIEMGKSPRDAALEGTGEVRLAVIATTFTVIAVFGPVGFLKGVVGQFFKQFGLTICFAMLISLFDALTIAPMLSAYFGGPAHPKRTGIWGSTVGKLVDQFSRFQDWLESIYERILRYTVKKPLRVLGVSFLIFIGSCATVTKVPKTFLPPQDAGEFAVSLDLPPGTNIERMTEVAKKVDDVIRSNPEVLVSALTIGSKDGGLPNEASFFIRLVPAKQRKINTIQMKEKLRQQLLPLAEANPKVKDYDAVGGGQRPFNLNIIGNDRKALEAYANQVFAWLKAHPGLKDVDINIRPGKPEFQVVPEKAKMERLGISTIQLGGELRTQIEGQTPVKFREEGREYDVRVRLKESQRDLRTGFSQTFVPNVNFSLLRLSDIAQGVETIGPSKINRQDRARFVQISSDIAPGAGMGNVMDDIRKRFGEGDLKLPEGMRFAFVGQAENFQELGESIMLAMGFGVLFIFLVLASLYESFVTPLTIMLALPLALCGAFVALFVTRESLNIFSMIGSIMLLGVSTKNSILLVDYANQLIRDGVERSEALVRAGKTRLRPILMTTFALIAGTLPIALGLNEASRQRTGMGIAIVGGLVSSTLLTLVVIPAAFSYIDRFRIWSGAWLARLVKADAPPKHAANGKAEAVPQKSGATAEAGTH